METPSRRICRKCNQDKPIAEFARHKACRYGVGHICLICKRLADAEYNKSDEHIAKRKERCKEWHFNNLEYSLWYKAKKRAVDRNMDFDISEDDIVIPDTCPVLGIPIHRNATLNSNNCPSLDRIDNTIGYVKGNIRVVSFRANSLKRDATLAEMKKIVEYMERETGV
jgi:hypothetical protein